MEHLQFPVGKFIYDAEIKDITPWIETLRDFPSKVETILETMTEDQLQTPYRPEGWTARQVVHHLADSHSHALLRFKTSLTEDKPTIKPYLEGAYAKLNDYTLPCDSAVSMLKGIHLKWVTLLENMSGEDLDKGYYHPESGRFFSLHNALALYAWHCRHHFGHLEICAK